MVIQSNFNDMVVRMSKCNAGPILAPYLCRWCWHYISAVPIYRTQILSNRCGAEYLVEYRYHHDSKCAGCARFISVLGIIIIAITKRIIIKSIRIFKNRKCSWPITVSQWSEHIISAHLYSNTTNTRLYFF